MGLIVTNGSDFFSEEKRQTDQQIEALADNVPAFRLTNTCMEGRYRMEKQILSDLAATAYCNARNLQR